MKKIKAIKEYITVALYAIAYFSVGLTFLVGFFTIVSWLTLGWFVKELWYNNSMTEEQVIEIVEKIEEQYMELDPDTWYKICEMLQQRAN